MGRRKPIFNIKAKEKLYIIPIENVTNFKVITYLTRNQKIRGNTTRTTNSNEEI